ncbi:MAG: hypothetical protein QM811_17595 [Pirellulales bacterium]
MPAELSDDLSAWPQSPFEILDVTWESDDRTLKRNYAARLKRFTPERMPEHFRKLRDAYEFVRGQFQFRKRNASVDETPATSVPTAPVPILETPIAPEPIIAPLRTGPTENDSQGDPTESLAADSPESTRENANSSERAPRESASHDPTPSRPLFPPDPLERWEEWNRAGDYATAYAELRAAVERKPHDSAYCVRLYWLLRIVPELDRARAPIDWLFHALARRGPLDWNAGQLFARDLAREPTIAFDPHYDKLLRDATPEALVKLLEWRWNAALRNNAERCVERDVAAAEPTLRDASDGILARMYLQALETLVWSRDRTLHETLFDAYAERLESLSEALVGDQAMFDRMDWLRAVVAGWRRLREQPTIPQEIVELLRKASLPGPTDYDWEIHDFLIHTHRRAETALKVFDAIVEHGGPAFLLFDNVLSQVSYPRRSETEIDERLGRLCKRGSRGSTCRRCSICVGACWSFV